MENSEADATLKIMIEKVKLDLPNLANIAYLNGYEDISTECSKLNGLLDNYINHNILYHVYSLSKDSGAYKPVHLVDNKIIFDNDNEIQQVYTIDQINDCLGNLGNLIDLGLIKIEEVK